MKTSKYIFFIIFTLVFSSSLLAQYGNQRRQQQQQRQVRQPKLQSVSKKALMSPEAMTEIIFYDVLKVFKRIKLKDKAKQNIISNAIIAYNNKITEIKGFGFLEFNAAKKLIKETNDLAELKNDPQLMQDAQKKLKNILFPIRKKVIAQQNILEAIIKKELSSKQYGKWLKIKKAKLYALRPQSKKNAQMQVQKGQGFQGQNYSRRY